MNSNTMQNIQNQTSIKGTIIEDLKDLTKETVLIDRNNNKEGINIQQNLENKMPALNLGNQVYNSIRVEPPSLFTFIAPGKNKIEESSNLLYNERKVLNKANEIFSDSYEQTKKGGSEAIEFLRENIHVFGNNLPPLFNENENSKETLSKLNIDTINHLYNNSMMIAVTNILKNLSGNDNLEIINMSIENEPVYKERTFMDFFTSMPKQIERNDTKINIRTNDGNYTITFNQSSQEYDEIKRGRTQLPLNNESVPELISTNQ